MKTFDVIEESRLTHVRELQTAVGKLRGENARLRQENATLLAHLDLAVVACRDIETLPAEGRLIIVDGWNVILGSKSPARPKAAVISAARNRKDLELQARRYLDGHPGDIVWIVLDGPRFATRTDGRLRITYTGGTGTHRADRFVCDFLKAALFRNALDRVVVRTDDRGFLADVNRLREKLCYNICS